MITDKPQKCLPFAPNWYLPQILHSHKNLVVFGSNTDIFIIDYNQKNFYTHLYNNTNNYNNNQEKMQQSHNNNQNNKQSQNPKISSLQFSTQKQKEKYILFSGNDQGQLTKYIFDSSSFEIQYTQQIFFKESIHQFFLISESESEQEDQILVFTPSGKFNLISIKNNIQQNLFEFSQTNKKSQLKKVINIPQQQQLFLILLDNGNIQIFNSEKREFVLQNSIFKNMYVLYADIIETSSNVIQLALLLKKGKSEITLQLQEINLDNFEQKVLKNVKFVFNYPKNSVQEKQINLQNQSISLSYLSKNQMLITGKLGEFYTLNLRKLLNNYQFNEIIFKFFSSDIQLDIENQIYQIHHEENHSQSVYDIFKFQSLFITVSTDRKINFFENNQEIQQEEEEQNFEKIWSLNCLGGKCSIITSSPLEPELLMFYCMDGRIKSWDFTKKNNSLFISDFGKNLPPNDNNSSNNTTENKIKAIVCHPEEEGILCLQKEFSTIIYDIYSEQLMGQMDYNQKLMKLQFFPKENQEKIIENLKKINEIYQNEETENQLLESAIAKNVYFLEKPKKQIEYSDQYIIKIFENNSIQICEIFPSYKLIFQSQLNLHITDFLFKKLQKISIMILANGKNLFMFIEDKFFNLQNLHTNNIRSLAVKKFKEKILITTSGFDRKISIFLYDIKNQTLYFIGYIKHKHPIISLKFSQKNFLLSICQNHETLSIYNLNPILDLENQYQFTKINENDANNNNFSCFFESNQSLLDQVEYANIRGHKGYLNGAEFCLQDPDTVVTISDDQTVKFWNIHQIQNKKVGNKPKKNKKRKRNQNSSNQIEETQQFLHDKKIQLQLQIQAPNDQEKEEGELESGEI